MTHHRRNVASVARYRVSLLNVFDPKRACRFFSLFPSFFPFLSFLSLPPFITIFSILSQVGDRLLVKPGALVPADGTVVSGDSTVDESMVSCSIMHEVLSKTQIGVGLLVR